MKKRLAIGIGVVIAAIAWYGARSVDDESPGATAGVDAAASATDRAAEPGRTRSGTLPAGPRTSVAIAGHVLDARSNEPVGGVEVVFRSDAGEQSVTASEDGAYRIELPPGTYRAFVRDETVLSVGRPERTRIPGLPAADAIGAPDEALMPVVVAHADLAGVDLTVMRGAVLRGRVLDHAGRPIANAVLRTIGPLRPALGTDVTESDADGRFELRLPAGDHELEASHARYAGTPTGVHVELEAGEIRDVEVTLAAGCVIAGRVVGPGGRAAGEGAIEQQIGDDQFGPTGRIAADGTFRWVTTEEAEVTLRAWPWKSPPSEAQRFTCSDGARFERVVFQLPDLAPSIAGLLVDRSGTPVPFAYLDVAPLDAGGTAQQERTDADGHWAIYRAAEGSYRVTAFAPGRGVAGATVRTGDTGVRIALGGTGRIEGTTPLIEHGSIRIALQYCEDESAEILVGGDERLVAITNGRFQLDDVPACNLSLTARWQNKSVRTSTIVPAGGTAQLEVSIGPPRPRTVHGVVRDKDGRPVEGASITAAYEDEHASATTDGAGRFTIETFAGATILASSAEHGMGSAELGTGDEPIEITVAPEDLAPGPGLEPAPDGDEVQPLE